MALILFILNSFSIRMSLVALGPEKQTGWMVGNVDHDDKVDNYTS